jgi:hypothetical protein
MKLFLKMEYLLTNISSLSRINLTRKRKLRRKSSEILKRTLNTKKIKIETRDIK